MIPDLDLECSGTRVYGNDHGGGACNIQASNTYKWVAANLRPPEARQLRDWLTEILEEVPAP